MNDIILSPLPLDNLLSQFREIIREEIQSEQTQRQNARLIGRAEAAKILNVSPITIDNHIRSGKLPANKVAGRVLIKYSDVLASLKQMKRFI